MENALRHMKAEQATGLIGVAADLLKFIGKDLVKKLIHVANGLLERLRKLDIRKKSEKAKK